MNLIVTSSPHASPSGADQLLHIGTNDGHADWGPGHFDGADLTLTTDYDTARDIFVSGNPQSAMQAFMEGKVKLQGDLTRLMAAQAVGRRPREPSRRRALGDDRVAQLTAGSSGDGGLGSVVARGSTSCAGRRAGGARRPARAGRGRPVGRP